MKKKKSLDLCMYWIRVCKNDMATGKHELITIYILFSVPSKKNVEFIYDPTPSSPHIERYKH